MNAARAAAAAIFLILPLPLVAGDYAAELVTRAHELKLAERLEWQALLHYKPRLIRSGVESQADDAAFFNAPDGKTNPASELDATLAAFFSTAEDTEAQPHPQCRFIARYYWLQQQLSFDPTRLQQQRCQRFHDWVAALNPQALTLVFPAAYLNNPASLYGHTLLRIDARGQDEQTRLLAYTISYAASSPEKGGFVFVAKGLFGGYSGIFSISPYYLKVTEYNDLENRDIWEYELNFADDEIHRLLMHVWELIPIRFDYYFFDENCAYHLLSLFDAARPSLRLTDRFPLWAVPADTVRVVTQEPGLLRAVRYRPARSTILRHRQQQLSREQIRLAQTIALAPNTEAQPALTALPESTRARVLEVAYEYLDYERVRGHSPLGEHTSARLQELLLARSRLDVINAEPPPVPRVRPDRGHGSARIGVALGRENGRAFQELRLRAVYHDLLDPEAGYNRGAQIEFGNLVLRHQAHESLRLQQLDIIDITSMSARDALLRPYSWKIHVSLARKHVALDLEPLMPHLQGGVGLAAEGIGGSFWYALLEGEADINGHLDRGYAIGAGPGIGGFVDVTAHWRIQLEARHQRYLLGDEHTENALALNQRFTLGRDSAMRIELSRRRAFGQVSRAATISCSLYF